EAEKEQRLFSELLGDSRYKPLGRQLDARAHRLIAAIEDVDYAEILFQELCTKDITMITGERGSEEVHEGVEEVIDFCISNIETIRIITTIVDRGRITCPVKVYNRLDASTYKQQRMVMIFDADDSGKIKRLEMRLLGEVEHKTGCVWGGEEAHEELQADNGL
ncbi:uncharacterized protein LY79DRAFT_494414, partial [Colletotrichum navitas]